MEERGEAFLSGGVPARRESGKRRRMNTEVHMVYRWELPDLIRQPNELNGRESGRCTLLHGAPSVETSQSVSKPFKSPIAPTLQPSAIPKPNQHEFCRGYVLPPRPHGARHWWDAGHRPSRSHCPRRSRRRYSPHPGMRHTPRPPTRR